MPVFEDIVESLNQKSLTARLGILIGIILVICGMYWYFFWSPKAAELEGLKVKLQKQQDKLKEYQAIAKELPKFEQENERLSREFEQAARKLPEEKEIPSLIDSIYAAVSASGLESVAFTPQGEVKKEIYAEIPIQMNVIGNYFELANFFDRISKLPRIVNVRDIDLAREDKRSRSRNIILDAAFTTVTFRLLPPPPPEPQTEGNVKGKPQEGSPEEEL